MFRLNTTTIGPTIQYFKMHFALLYITVLTARW